jgi:hypothetical protein
MSRLCRFFIILIAACTVVGCSEPEEDTVDFMWAELNRSEYKKDEYFTPNDYLTVYTSFQGEEPKKVLLDLVDIYIAEPHNYLPEELQPVSIKTGYKLENEGTYLVIVEYLSRSAISPIVVSAAGSGPEIIIEWKN